MEVQYIYLIHEREFIQSEKKIYKFGKTRQLNFKRFAQYPKDSASDKKNGFQWNYQRIN